MELPRLVKADGLADPRAHAPCAGSSVATAARTASPTLMPAHPAPHKPVKSKSVTGVLNQYRHFTVSSFRDYYRARP
jgi:hypothetical protein